MSSAASLSRWSAWRSVPVSAAPILLVACSHPSAPRIPKLVVAIEAGPRHTCALTDSARAYCWGGIPTSSLQADSLATAEPTPVRGDFRWRSIGVGDGFACGLTYEDEARCWALSASTKVPDGRVGDPLPARVPDDPRFRALRVGGGHVCGFDAGGFAYCWGDNFRGQLGIGVFGGILWGRRQTPTPVAGNPSFSALSLGAEWTCGLAPNGDVYCWGGSDTSGPGAAPVLVLSGQGFATLETGGPSGGRDHTCGLNGAGALSCWWTFMLGPPQPVPVVPPAGIALNTPRIGGFGFQYHACALAPDGAAFCWGDNTEGQLGDGTTTARADPTAAAPGLHFQMISAGGAHSCGATPTGEAYCWGGNTFGELGTGHADASPVTVPVRVNVFAP